MDRPSMCEGTSSPAMSKIVGAKSILATMLEILKQKIPNQINSN